jgi:hypothetical protein
MERRDNDDLIRLFPVKDDIRELWNERLTDVEVHGGVPRRIGCHVTQDFTNPSDERYAQPGALFFIPVGSLIEFDSGLWQQADG